MNLLLGLRQGSRGQALIADATFSSPSFCRFLSLFTGFAREGLRAATARLQETCQRHGIRDHIVAVEMTGVYHRPVQRAFRKGGSETRLVHPFASRHFRQPSHADTKTDDIDLESIFREAINGFGLLQSGWPEVYKLLQLINHYVIRGPV